MPMLIFCVILTSLYYKKVNLKGWTRWADLGKKCNRQVKLKIFCPFILSCFVPCLFYLSIILLRKSSLNITIEVVFISVLVCHRLTKVFLNEYTCIHFVIVQIKNACLYLFVEGIYHSMYLLKWCSSQFWTASPRCFSMSIYIL